ncbi:MAG: arsenic metallochaperone ArsD family protein [Candidatus Omnitrophica bacterium]|nr:arsenic metallochaperone ArsD family protein [Candidatus Omnitrophota bacterium]MCM8808998.1 arsenic metallochaperone ArsD family protein [Candidatus Omnitrophota bacterium]
MEKNGKVLKIFTIPQTFPCGPRSSCCGPIGLSDEEVNFLVNTAKKVFTGEIKVFNLMEEEVQINNKQVVSLVSSLGWGCLPIISLDDKIISLGMPSSEQELIETLKSNLY